MLFKNKNTKFGSETDAMPPYPAALIAYAFVKKGIETGNFVSQMKLQKMVYFANGYHLAVYNTPLIMEDFEAWDFGPVVPSIYQQYKLYGSSPISDTFFANKIVHEKKLATLSMQAVNTINFTWDATSHLSASTLSNWTHKEASPWKLNYDPVSRNAIIPSEDIREYFKTLLYKPVNPINQ